MFFLIIMFFTVYVITTVYYETTKQFNKNIKIPLESSCQPPKHLIIITVDAQGATFIEFKMHFPVLFYSYVIFLLCSICAIVESLTKLASSFVSYIIQNLFSVFSNIRSI